jgi:hypothetical protein
VAQRVRQLDYLTTHTSLSPIRRGFVPGFENYKKGALDSQPQVIKFTSCFPMVGGSLRVLRLPPPLKLIAMIKLKYCWKWCLTINRIKSIILFCSHKKDMLFPQHTILFPPHIMLFPQYIVLFPQHIILFPQYIILFPQHIILFPQYIILFPQYIIINTN